MTSLRSFLFCGGLAFLTVAGCADSEDRTIDYQLTGGFVGIHASAHIDPDGKITRIKQDGSTVTGQLDAAALADLQAKVDQAQFATLDAAYNCNCADDVLHTITVHVDGAERTVKADGTADYPDRLKPLIDALVQIVENPLMSP